MDGLRNDLSRWDVRGRNEWRSNSDGNLRDGNSVVRPRSAQWLHGVIADESRARAAATEWCVRAATASASPRPRAFAAQWRGGAVGAGPPNGVPTATPAPTPTIARQPQAAAMPTSTRPAAPIKTGSSGSTINIHIQGIDLHTPGMGIVIATYDDSGPSGGKQEVFCSDIQTVCTFSVPLEKPVIFYYKGATGYMAWSVRGCIGSGAGVNGTCYTILHAPQTKDVYVTFVRRPVASVFAEGNEAVANGTVISGGASLTEHIRCTGTPDYPYGTGTCAVQFWNRNIAKLHPTGLTDDTTRVDWQTCIGFISKGDCVGSPIGPNNLPAGVSGYVRFLPGTGTG